VRIQIARQEFNPCRCVTHQHDLPACREHCKGSHAQLNNSTAHLDNRRQEKYLLVVNAHALLWECARRLATDKVQQGGTKGVQV
jgi:hypothetical protein